MKITIHKKTQYFLVSIIILQFFIIFHGIPLISTDGVDPEHKEQFTLDDGDTRFIMAHLSDNETWYVNCTSVYTGKFYLFLFDERPVEKFVSENGEIDDKIYEEAIIYNTTPSQIFSENINSTVFTISLNFTASVPDYREELLYYIQVICVSGGPDAFILISPTHEIQPYYIPFIPGYSGKWILISIIPTVLLLFKKYKMRRPE